MNKSFVLLATALSFSCAFSSALPPNVFPRGAVVLFQGDSITHGGRGGDMNHYLGHGYAAEIAMRYCAYRPEMGVRFFNRAVSGESSKNLLERWHRDAFPFLVTEKGYEREFGKGEASLVPDVLSLLVGINGRRSEPKYHTTPEEYAANLVSLVTNAIAANPRVRIVLGQPFSPNPDADLRARQQAAERVAHDYGCVFVPYQRLFDERLMKIVPNVNYWTWDGVHPTYAAHMMMADFWFETVAAESACKPVVVLDQPGWCNWCPSPAYLPDGRVALAFSRWPTKFGFETWKAKSEIALAISKSDPLGPYEFVGTILPGSGVEGAFDRDVTHNPCLFVDGGKYYLYYMGTNSGDDHNRTSAVVGSEAWKYCGSHQQVGVAVADRVEGPYRRTGKPLFELAPDMTTLSNPAICRMPNGKYLMIVKWGEKDGIPRGYPKCRVNHFAAVADNPLGPFEIVNREVFAVPCANFPGEDPYLWEEGETICCAIHDMGRFYSNEDRALIRFESKDGVNWKNCGVLFPRGNISRLERPAILCGKDGSRLLFAASKPDAKDPNSMIVAYSGVVPEPLKAKPAPEPLRFVTFNIWGDYFKNPVGEREDGILSTILRLGPDVLSLQEVTPSWWDSKLFAGLEQAGYGIVRGDEDAALVRAGGDLANRKRTWVNHEPLLYRKDRLTLLDSGLEFFHLSIGAEKSATWGVFEDQRDGRRFISFATHLWWQYNGDESEALRELNVRKILDVLSAVKAKWGELPVIGGGDLNCKNEGQSALVAFERAGYSDAGKCADVFSTVPSEHTDPVRGADGRYRGERGVIGKKGHCMLDRIYYTKGVHALCHDVDCTQEALDASDHSPLVVDFKVEESCSR